MNIHEYQGKEVLKTFGVAIQEGIVAETPEAAVKAAQDLQKQTGTGWWVVKSQIHAGGRGKGKIRGTEQRGVALAKSLDDVKTISENILGNVLVTIQTGEAGKKVNKVSHSYEYEEFNEVIVHRLSLSNKTFANIALQLAAISHPTMFYTAGFCINPQFGWLYSLLHLNK